VEELIRRFAEHGYLAVFVLMTLESACIPIPSEVTMLFAGFLVSRGEIDFVGVALAGTFANLVGSWIAYAAGRTGGRALLERYGKYILVREHEIARAEAWFARHGELAVFVSRMLPVVRTFISLPAGIAEMPLSRFSVYTFAGSLPWVFALTGAGWALGENWNDVLGSFTAASIAIGALVVIAFGAWYLKRRRAAARRQTLP
jgi:membrane protein DedA with SNARE-associated domain